MEIKVCMDLISSISFPNEVHSMNLWSVEHEHFSNIFVIFFGWVQQQSNSKPTQKWWQNEKKHGQLVRVAFVKK